MSREFVSISTHAPYTEGDILQKMSRARSMGFQLTPPIQRATIFNDNKNLLSKFQLTPPIQRATQISSITSTITVYFNSRPLYRGRLTTPLKERQIPLFQLTPPIQRATLYAKSVYNRINISTHAPYTEGDSRRSVSRGRHPYFNSRPLYRGRP